MSLSQIQREWIEGSQKDINEMKIVLDGKIRAINLYYANVLTKDNARIFKEEQDVKEKEKQDKKEARAKAKSNKSKVAQQAKPKRAK
jgi:hypothetical protein